MLKILRCAVVALMLTPTLGNAQNLDAGLAAAETGDYATALREWMPLAEQGYAAAQFNLALMYANGWGVPQNYSEAIRWYQPKFPISSPDCRAAAGHCVPIWLQSAKGQRSIRRIHGLARGAEIFDLRAPSAAG